MRFSKLWLAVSLLAVVLGGFALISRKYIWLYVTCTMVHEAAHTCGHPREGAPSRAEAQAFGGICPQ